MVDKDYREPNIFFHFSRVMPEFRDMICICNYRFIKEFTKGVDSDWTVNIVNHFKASDLAEEANQ